MSSEEKIKNQSIPAKKIMVGLVVLVVVGVGFAAFRYDFVAPYLGILLVTMAVYNWHSRKKLQKIINGDEAEVTHTKDADMWGALLKKMLGSLSNSVVVFDENQHLVYANKAFCKKYSLDDSVQKTIQETFGDEECAFYTSSLVAAIDKPESSEVTYEKGGDMVQYLCVPLAQVPDKESGDFLKAVMFIERKVSAIQAKAANKKSASAQGNTQGEEKLLGQFMDALASFVDQRNPYASNHSKRVEKLATSIASAMNVDKEGIKTIKIASQLVNIGTITLSAEIFTRTTPLTEREKKEVIQSIYTAADIMGNVEFDGPVIEVLRQFPERMDGTGPMKLTKDDILLQTRIISVANAVIAMTSPRAYRPPMDRDEMLGALEEEKNDRFDDKVVDVFKQLLVDEGDEMQEWEYVEMVDF